MIELLDKNFESKKHTDFYRPFFALNRNSAGITSKNKEYIYTLVSDKLEGPYLFDVDGNKYIDLTMGFGAILLGHKNKLVQAAIEDQLNKSWSVGPITPLAGELAKEICDVTNNDRAAFFNSGTEAIMVAMRLAKAKTGKKHIVFFKGAYHGTFDSLMSIKANAQSKRAEEMVPGITQSILNESFLLNYGSEESLAFIRENKDDIAAVLVELSFLTK
jgi:glutamate-1-semialdehyde aminotransferase